MKKILKQGFPFWALLLLSSCICEDRSNCPSWLNLDFSAMSQQIESVHLIFQSEKGIFFLDTLFPEEWQRPYEIPLKKGRISLAVFCNIQNMQLCNDAYLIPIGEQADPIHTDFQWLDLTHETETLHILPKKNHITLFMNLIGYHPEKETLEIIIQGTAQGYDLNGNVVLGSFSSTAQPTPLAHIVSDRLPEFSCRIPRQKDNKLELIVRVRDSITHRFPLGQAMMDAGLNMQQETLDDWHFTLDLSKLSLTLDIEDWIELNPYEVNF